MESASVLARVAGRKQSVGSIIWIFGIALILNLVWEFLHVRLYTTQVTSTYLVWQSVKDALWISLAYLLAPNVYVFALGLFVFAYVVELHALRTKRWEYTKSMPLVFGVGLSPLLELAVTGVATVLLTPLVL